MGAAKLDNNFLDVLNNHDLVTHAVFFFFRTCRPRLVLFRERSPSRTTECDTVQPSSIFYIYIFSLVWLFSHKLISKDEGQIIKLHLSHPLIIFTYNVSTKDSESVDI